MSHIKKILFLLGVLFLIVFVWQLYAYLQPLPTPQQLPGSVTTVSPSSVTTPLPQHREAVPYTVEPFVKNLRVPWSIVFTAPNRILVSERPGRVREVLNGQLQPQPLRTFTEVSKTGEEGLMGMVLDPAYRTTQHIFLCIAYQRDGHTVDKVVRVTDHDNTLDQDTIILDNIPAAQFHAGCRLRFGPDEKLYITTGDATNRTIAQDLNSLGGKLLRINKDGSIPPDNPFPNSPVWSYGHRNAQGFDWHPLSGALIETEHGPSLIDGPAGGDEVNVIQKGANYGWPIVSHERSAPDMQHALLVFTPAIAPGSGMFYRSSVFPQLTNTFLFGMLKGEGIMRVTFDTQHPPQVISYEKLAGIQAGRVRDVVEGPDGFIYFTTSNQDGRGKAQAGDDHIYRLVPSKHE